MNAILPLQNPIMNYAWGSRFHISNLLGQPTPSDEPEAELWMGAHPKAPSCVGGNPLTDLIAADPQGMLGSTTASRFSSRLPFLFKLLAAGAPLSIQAHPNQVQAKEGFAAENAAGIPLDAPNRNYRDENHKPEILCALTDFWGLNGFREIPTLLALLDEAGINTIAGEVAKFRQNANREGLREFFRTMVGLGEEQKSSVLNELTTSAERLRENKPEYDWILRISDSYPGDIGVLCVLLLNLVKLAPGQAMFCAAGDLHAYLDGFGVELMANSDNVLRGGLTPKHVDIHELMKTLTFQDRDVEVLTPNRGRYETPTEEFSLSVCHVNGRESFSSSESFEIIINVSGSAKISCSSETGAFALPQGSSVAIPATVIDYLIEGNATVYRASVGIV